jgi:alpha-amylase/alpha-mannosidase (GH57 family)
MTQHCICIHGHFYQPPRENPWLEEIEIQDSAHPYHDWNARITAECYTRNAAARILDAKERIVRITNNYARMSFNFGPTLLHWMAQNSADVYAAILEADRRSSERFSGHGSAIAQPYNHMILPLANTADRTTQILWGIRDFQHRFGRAPEGMWLPEAAVDLETLAIMAEMGITFTILSPYQAGRVRPLGVDGWSDVSDGSIDPRMPYVQRLPEDRSMAVFFYDGPISRDVAFNGLLNNGEAFAGRLLAAFEGERDDNQLVHIATDGETFGHHHRYGDMALAYALEKIDSGNSARLTNYGEFLEKQPPTWEVEIKENTAWSCAHGVERWKSDCGCQSGRRPDWNQSWRGPLRNALDWLRDALAEAFVENSRDLFADPWQARNDYIEVILDRSTENIDRFLKRHLAAPPDETNRIRALKLLEMQRQAMLMYTSCGWFFDELSGIETVQVIQYAGRAVQLAEELFASEIEMPLLEKLAAAKSNIPKHRDGRHIYEKWVKPSSVDLKKAAAHYAISSFFEDYPQSVSIYCYFIENLDNRSAEAGRAKIAVGRAQITSQITRETAQFHYAVFHMGDHSISCGISRFDEKTYLLMAEEVLGVFDKSDIPGVFRCLGKYFQDAIYSLMSLFRDEQRKVLNTILEATTTDTLAMYRQLYDNHVSLMRFINDSSSRIPKALYVAGEIVVNSDLNHEFDREELDYDAINNLTEDAERAGIAMDAETLEFTLRNRLEQLARKFQAAPDDLDLLDRLARGVELAVELPFLVRFQEIQNIHYTLGRKKYADFRARADKGDDNARQWVATFLRLAEVLKIRLPTDE